MAKISYEEMMHMLRIQRYQEIANYDKVIHLGIDAMWRELCDKVDDPNIDPIEIYDTEVENLRNIEYSMQLMNICCLSETWEQDLYNFIKEKGLNEIRSNDIGRTIEAFERGYSECAVSNYPLIAEMRALVNAIKHGEGRSLTNIRQITSDAILADSNIGEMNERGEIVKRKQIDFDNNTLTSRTLNVEGKLQIYSDEIVKFWEDVFKADKAKQTQSQPE